MPAAAIAPFTAVLLAGGRSTRMGRDKAALVIDGVPLWQRQLATLRALPSAELLISGPHEGPWSGAEVSVVPDDHTGLGPLGGLATILPRMQCERALVLAVDLPAMTSDFLGALLAMSPADGGIVPVLDDRCEPLAAIYPRAMVPIIAAQLAAGDRSLQARVRAGVAAGLLTLRRVAGHERPLFQNVNAPADLRGA
jgi:molybdopterin-guanine dinucleotide biosynthesis protein A